MKVALFYHSLVSDWNNGNAHFLRGITGELQRRGHSVRVFEPRDGWSVTNLVRDHGEEPLAAFRRTYPTLTSEAYDLDTLDLDRVLDDIDLVIVHEWNDPQLVSRIGRHRRLNTGYRLLFHDTHHRCVSHPDHIERFELWRYDGALVFGATIREQYLRHGWVDRVWVWHEAADTTVFYPRQGIAPVGDLVWVGNWGDDERNRELYEYLLNPINQLGLQATIFGVRYPSQHIEALHRLGIHYGRWLANFEVPHMYARYRVTVHVPRRFYTERLHGIPTIRPFEALACGIPLICAPWFDTEHLFRPGEDYLVASNGRAMREAIRDVLADDSLRELLARNGRTAIARRHTCAHRVNELLTIAHQLGMRNVWQTPVGQWEAA